MPNQQIVEVEEGDEQRRDAMLLKLLKTPPKQRPKRARETEKVIAPRVSAENPKQSKP